MFFAYLRENTTLLIDVGKICAIDECLMLYKGRLHFKQYIKTKRARFGLKLFCLCASAAEVRGYTYNFSLYIGKDIYDVSHIPGGEELSMSERIIIHLLQNNLSEGREVIIDNWYMSVRLAEFLLSKNTYVTGTIRTNRGVPKELNETQLRPYQSCFIRNKDLLLVKFRDKRDVYVLTSKLTASFVEKSRHNKGQTSTQNTIYKKPEHIEHYNQNMGAVDAVDQDLEPYNAARKSFSWFKKVGIHMLQRMVLNSRVLYSVCNNKKKQMPMSDYTLFLCEDILAKYVPNYEEIKNSYEKISQPQREEHKLICLPKNEQKRRRCTICYNKYKKTRYTVNFCYKCNVALCSQEHFIDFHN